MKKVVCLLVVFAFATPVLANEITFDVVADPCDGSFAITYIVDGGSADIPVGIGLNVLLTGGANITGVVADSVDPCFPVYLDYAHDFPSTYDFDPPQGDPLADPDAAGQATLPAAEVSICMGGLETTAEKGVTKTLIELQTDLGEGECCYVTLATDDLRGAVVGSVFIVNVPGAPVEVCRPGIACFDTGHADYALWVEMGEPYCWCYKYQCYGDANGSKDGGLKTGQYYVQDVDFGLLLPAWKTNPGDAAFNVCADFSRSYDGGLKTGQYYVQDVDFGILLTNWKASDAEMAALATAQSCGGDEFAP